MTEERKHAILFAPTVLAARKPNQLDSDKPSPARMSIVENAIRQAAYILEVIDKKWPNTH